MLRIYRFIILLTIISNTGIAQKMEQLGSSINTEYNEVNPIIAPDNKTLYFSRISHPSNNFGAKGSEDVWYSELRDDGIWTIARRMPNSVNKDQYNELFSVTPDGNTILISGAYTNGRRDNEAGLSMCRRTKTGWSDPVKIVIPKFDEMCKGQYLTATLSNDAKTLIMAFSEKKNGKEDDLYVSTLGKDGKWTKPEPLTGINSGSSETTPFLASDSRTLYFASDRKDGLGGLDIWKTTRIGKAWDKWTKPINLGNKINTDANDMYFSMAASGEFAYMMTKKNSAGKGDIVRFRLKEDKKEDATVGAIQTASTTPTDNSNKDDKSKTQSELDIIKPKPVVLVSGKLVDAQGRPVDARIIFQTLPDGEEVGVANSNPATGEYKITLPRGAKYSIRAEADGKIAMSKNIDLTQGTDEYKEITGQDITIVPIGAGVSVTLNNLFFAFGKAAIAEDSYPELDRMVEVMNQYPTMVVEIHGHTDNIGSNDANLKLSQDRADAVRNYLISKKIGMARLSSKGFGETKPLASNDTEEGRDKNRRVEFVIIKK
ncbi:MAG: OmpA family protein [Spirosomataceae bacterium]